MALVLIDNILESLTHEECPLFVLVILIAILAPARRAGFGGGVTEPAVQSAVVFGQHPQDKTSTR